MIEVLEMAVRFRLRELLEERTPRMSQSELARQSGVSVVTINAIANNRTRQVQLETLDALCGVLDCQPGELLEREQAKRKASRVVPRRV